MNREILFRGLRTDGKGWVEGCLIITIKNFKKVYQILNWDDNDNLYDVHPESVGQFTGLTDKNGKRIFEGDIMKFTESGEICVCQVLFIDGKWTAGRNIDGEDMIVLNGFDCLTDGVIIGNIHETKTT